MPFLLIRDDITKVHADVIVNPANTKLLQGDGTSRAIYLAAGEEKLTEACRKIGSCAPGKAVITEGFGLSAKYIIHAVGPVWRGGFFGEKIVPLGTLPFVTKPSHLGHFFLFSLVKTSLYISSSFHEVRVGDGADTLHI